MREPMNGSLKLQNSFLRPRFSVLKSVASPGACCVPELVLHNAVHNGAHTFCLQESEGMSDGSDKYLHVTFGELGRVVENCASRLPLLDSNILPSIVGKDGNVTKSKPVALFLESGVTLFVHLVALLTLNVPCLLLSTRLSPAAAQHIINVTGTSAVITSPRTQKAVDLWASEETVSPKPKIIHAINYEDLARGTNSESTNYYYLRKCVLSVREDDRDVLILHSSGSTGLPKPIRLAHRYLLGYCGCHLFSEEQDESHRGLNLSTLPFFHGFGLLAPCLALSVGKPVCLPPPSRIPSADLMLESIRRLPVTSVMTVPSILEDFTNMECFETSVDDLVRLDFVTVGGGAIKPNVGATLRTKGVTILNHFGATELGALSPIFRPDKNYDWHYLRLRQDLGLELNRVDVPSSSTISVKLKGYPFAWDSAFELQDQLLANPDHPQSEVRILGRMDDLIVLGNGEKILPHRMEQSLEQHPAVKRAVVFGSGRSEVGVLIEPLADCKLSPFDLVDSLWPKVLEANEIVDQHACLLSKKAILIKQPNKQIPVSDKGVVQRLETYDTFQAEIQAVYDELEAEDDFSSVEITADNVEEALRALVQQCLPSHVQAGSWENSDDFFNLGMDSLRAARLRRLLSAALLKADRMANLKPSVANGFIYNNPSVDRLLRALKARDINVSDETTDVAMKSMSAKYSFQNQSPDDNFVVLITGATGHLGCNLLNSLCQNPKVKRVICLARSTRGSKGDLEHDAPAKQNAALEKNRIVIPDEILQKVTYYGHRPGSEGLGLTLNAAKDISQTVTHIFHGAWPMDFKQQLPSFEVHVKTLRDLIDVGLEAHRLRPHIRPRILLASSIAAVGRYPTVFKHGIVPERIFEETEVPVNTGYAQAKWVCEKVMQSASAALAGDVQPMIVRIGQLAGSHTTGYWNPKEHVPALMRASKAIGRLPLLKGTVSWLPMDQAAQITAEILLEPGGRQLVYHLENPIRQSWEDICTMVEAKLGLTAPRVSLEDWLAQTASIDSDISSLEEFFRDDFARLSSGSLVLSTASSQSISRTLREVGGVDQRTLETYFAG